MRVLLWARRRVAMLTLIMFTGASSGCFSEHVDQTMAPPDPNCPVPASAQGTGKAVVKISGYRFSPDTLRVSRNTTVTWVNCDAAARTDAHTTTSDQGVWSSPLFAQGTTYARVFDRTGSFPYHCTPHPTMKAVIVVQ